MTDEGRAKGAVVVPEGHECPPDGAEVEAEIAPARGE